jgi:hypothetical protein
MGRYEVSGSNGDSDGDDDDDDDAVLGCDAVLTRK